MSNYAQTTFFTPKDTLPISDPNKTIFGAAYDVEFGNIATAIASKYDSNSTPTFAGAVTAPAFIPNGTSIPTNGMYLPAANTVGWSTAGVARGSVNSTGNWTINAPSSGTALQVTGLANVNAIAATDGTATIGILFDGAHGAYTGTITNNALNLLSNNITRVIIGASGNVTINAPSSGRALLVNGTNAGIFGDIEVFGTNAALGLADSGVNGALLAISATNSSGYIINATWNTASAGNLKIQTGNVDRLTIAPAGNVTVNAPSSGVALTVVGASGANTISANGFVVAQAGNVTIAAPSSGTTLGLTFINNVGGLTWTDGITSGEIAVNASHQTIIGTTTAHDVGIFTSNNGPNFVVKAGQTAPILQGFGPTAAGLVDMTPDKGTFTITYTGMTAAVTGTAVWSRNGNQVILFFPVATGTSNATTCTATGLPAAITPTRVQWMPASVNGSGLDSGASIPITPRINTDGTVTFSVNGNTGGTAGFTATGTKGVANAFSVTYLLN